MTTINFRNNWKGNDYQIMDYNLFVDSLQNGRDYYEFTGDKEQQSCFYIDIDEYVDEATWNLINEPSDFSKDEKKYEEYENQIVANIMDFLPTTNNEFAKMRNHRVIKNKNKTVFKFSLRLNFYNLVGKKSDFVKIINVIKKSVKNLDTGVYDPNRKMRCVFTAKPETHDKPLELVEGTPEQTLIQYYKNNDGWVEFTWDDFANFNNINKNEMNLQTDTNTQINIDIISKNIQKMNNIEKKLFVLRSCFEKGEYNNWFKIGCILRSICNFEEGLQYFVNASYVAPFDNEDEKEKTTRMFQNINPSSSFTLKSLDAMCQTINSAEYEKYCTTVIEGGDNEAGEIIYNELKNVFVYSAGKYWYKLNNKWYNNEKEVKPIVKNYILNRGLVTSTVNEKGKTTYRLYGSYNNNAKNILDVLCGKCIQNKDENFSNKFIETTKDKICFQNGVLNLETKDFKSWEQSQDVFTTIIIDYDFNPQRNEHAIEEVMNKIFISIFGNDDYKRALHFFARGIGGNVQDKSWGMFIGSRNCGKGVNECLFKNTFKDYIGSISSDLFIYKGKNTGDDLKLWGWVQDVESNRLCFIQESKINGSDSNLKLDGVMIKKISGGDVIQNRRNHQDPINSSIQTTFMFNANDVPPFTKGSGCCMDTCSTFASAKQFKSDEFISEKRENGACEAEMSLYFERDDNIKDHCKTMEWRQALIHIILDNFGKKSVKCVNSFKEEDSGDDHISKVLKAFTITNDPKDRETNISLKEWAGNNDVHFSKKLKPLLKQFGCEEYRTGTERGWKKLKLNPTKEAVIED